MAGLGYRQSLMLANMENGGILKQASQRQSGGSEYERNMENMRTQMAADDAARADYVHNATQFHFGVLNGLTGELENPGTGEVMKDAQGRSLLSQSDLANLQSQKLASMGINPNNGDAGIAESARAFRGYNPGEQTKDEVQANTMRSLGDSIMNLPPEDRQIAYERAVGVMAGRGDLKIHDMPEWTKGGQQFMAAMQNQKDTQDQMMQVLKNQGAVQAAAAGNKNNKDPSGTGLTSAPTAPIPLKQQLTQTLNDPNSTPLVKTQTITAMEKMGLTGDPGEPVGAPVTARAVKTFTAANETLKNVDSLATLIHQNPDMNLFKPKVSNALGGLGNTLLSPQQQQFNVLTSHINDAITNMSGDASIDKNQLNRLSDQLPSVGDAAGTIAQKLSTLRDEAAGIKVGIDPTGHIQRLLDQPQLNPAQQSAAGVVGASPTTSSMDPVSQIMQSHPELSRQQATQGFQMLQQRQQQSAQSQAPAQAAGPQQQGMQQAPQQSAPPQQQQQGVQVPPAPMLQPGDVDDYNPDLTARGIL